MVEDEDLLELVNAGMLPLIVVDEHKAKAWAGALPSIGLRDDLVLRSGGQIAWAYRKRSPKLADYLASFAKATARGTEFGNIVGDRYLVDAEQLRHNGPDDQRRFLQLLAQFRRFGDRYRFDPLLLAAQGFQESGLDQSKRNPGGAVGIMQLRPETARDPSVDIRGIDRVENNIEAGAKYLRHLIDVYFADPGHGRVQPHAVRAGAPTMPGRRASPTCAAGRPAAGSIRTAGSGRSNCRLHVISAARR